MTYKRNNNFFNYKRQTTTIYKHWSLQNFFNNNFHKHKHIIQSRIKLINLIYVFRYYFNFLWPIWKKLLLHLIKFHILHIFNLKFKTQFKIIKIFYKTKLILPYLDQEKQKKAILKKNYKKYCKRHASSRTDISFRKKKWNMI